MKTLAVLFLLAVAIGVAVQWRNPIVPVPTPHERDEANQLPPSVPIGARAAPATVQAAPVAVPRLPPSFSGTRVDGQLRADASDRLIIDNGIRRVFDYFLASIGEEPIEASVARLRQYIEVRLPPPAEGQALQLLGQYLDYKRQLLHLEHNHPVRADLGAMRERLHAVQQLRRRVFGDAVHAAFFSLDEAADRFMLERLAIGRDPALDSTAKGAAIDRLQSALPPELRDRLAIDLQSELREQSRALESKGASVTELRQLRQQLVGNAAADRLERLDRDRQAWLRRLADYRHEKQRIESSRGLGEADKRAAIRRLAAERFNENERRRLEAAEQLLVQENG